MKKLIACIILIALALPVVALCDTSFDGKVVAVDSVAVLAPFGGTISCVTLRKGDMISVGDNIAHIGTTINYAPQSGTVGGIFASEGDDVTSVTERYGAVMYIEPENKYKISASTEKSYNSSENKFISVGEEVYLSCTKDGSHEGRGMICKVEESDDSGNCRYTLEVISGEFYMGETVGIYRTKNYEAQSCIGYGTVLKNAAIAVSGSGSVLRINVKRGDRIERGENLFETVEGMLDGFYAMDPDIVSDVEGVISSVDIENGGSVSKGSAMLKVYPLDSFRIEITLREMDLADVKPGDKVYIDFDYDEDYASEREGIVESISYISESEGNTAEYKAYITFEADPEVRLGMSTVVYTADDETAD